jgi:hypothetical protein
MNRPLTARPRERTMQGQARIQTRAQERHAVEAANTRRTYLNPEPPATLVHTRTGSDSEAALRDPARVSRGGTSNMSELHAPTAAYLPRLCKSEASVYSDSDGEHRQFLFSRFAV